MPESSDHCRRVRKIWIVSRRLSEKKYYAYPSIDRQLMRFTTSYFDDTYCELLAVVKSCFVAVRIAALIYLVANSPNRD
jgi:hypothetical protein